MTTSELLTLARKHLHNGAAMATSAEVCMNDAVQQYDAGDFQSARYWALKSLKYSIGIFHNDYKKADDFVVAIDGPL